LLLNGKKPTFLTGARKGKVGADQSSQRSEGFGNSDGSDAVAKKSMLGAPTVAIPIYEPMIEFWRLFLPGAITLHGKFISRLRFGHSP
jgi:hypothetical protein